MSLRSRIRDEELGPYSTHPAYAFANIRRAFVLAGSFSLLVVGLALLGLWQWSSKLTLAEIIDKLLNGQAAGVIGGIIFAVAIPVASALLTYLICLRLASQPGNRRSPLDAYATLVTAAVVVAGLVFLMWLTLGVFKDADTQASILGALSLVTFAALMLVMWVAEGFDLSTLAKAVFGLRSFTVFGTSIAVWWALMQGIFNATTVPMLKYLASSDTARAFVPAVTLLPILAGFALTVKKWFIPAVLRAASESAKADHIDEEAVTQGLDRPTPIPLGADAFPQPKRPAVSNAVPQESTPADDESSGESIKASSEPPPPGFADSLKGWYEEQFGASVRHTVQITPSEQTCTVADAQDLSVFFGGPPTEDQERFMRTAERNAERTLTDPEASGDLLLHGPEGSGRTTSLLALAITACIDRGCRTLLLTPTTRSADLAHEELMHRIERMHFKEALLAARMDSGQMAKMVQVDNPRIPEIWVGTPQEFESVFFGTKTDNRGTQRLSAILERMQCILIDDIDLVEDQVRNHLPFLVEKIRLLLRLAGHSLQVVGALESPSSATLRNVSSRVLRDGANQSIALRPPRSERIELVEVPVRTGENPAEIMRTVATRVAASSRGLDVIVPGVSRAEMASIEVALTDAGGRGQVHPDADAFRLRRQVICAFTRFRKAIANRRAIIVHRLGPSEIPVVVTIGEPSNVQKGPRLIMLPSHRSAGFAVPHLRSIARYLHPWVPGHRDLWARFGLGGVGDLLDLPLAGVRGTGIGREFKLAIDPSELESRSVTSSSHEIWPWVAVTLKSDEWRPVDLRGPISTLERMHMDDRATTVHAGHCPTDTGKPNAEPLIDWTDDQGQVLGTTSLAYGDLLTLRREHGTFYPTEILMNPTRIRGRRMDVDRGNEPIVPIWQSSLRIRDDAVLVSQEGGDLARYVARFGMEAGRPDASPKATLRTLERLRERAADSNAAFEIEAQLAGAIDSHGTVAEFGRPIRCQYPVRGSMWFILSGSDPKTLAASQLWVKSHAAKSGSPQIPFVGVWNAQRDDRRPPAAWAGQLWPELSALLQIGLRQTVLGWQTLGRTMAFIAEGELANHAHAVIFMIEPLPTQGTVNKTLSELWSDSALLNQMLLAAIEAADLTADSQIMEPLVRLSILARTMQRPSREAENSARIGQAKELLMHLQSQLVRIAGIDAIHKPL